MAEMKNICGKIPLELHTKVRQEIEQREISTQQFIQQVIEEHFTEKGGQVSMAVRTVAVQVSEELFARFKAAVAKKGCKQKDFLIALIEKAIEEIEAEFGEEKEPEIPVEETAAETPPAEQEEESGEPETGEIEEPVEAETGEAGETVEPDAGETEESEEPIEPDAEESEESAEPEAEGAEDALEGESEESADAEEPEESESSEAPESETDNADDTATEE